MLINMSDVTRILSQIESGDPSAAEQLLPLVYDELRRLAAAKLAHEKPGQTLQATALVHEPVLRRVALKIIKPGMDSREVVARFEAERQALPMMNHPYIAQVFDGGVTDGGRPYFVMELVTGVPITEY